MSWSSENSYTDSSVSSDTEFAYGADKVEIDLQWNMDVRQYKTVFTKTLTVKTPFADYEDNKLDATLEYSQRLFKLTVDGHKGSSANPKTFELYKKHTKNTFESYMKTTLFALVFSLTV